jgi:hypothetical protein
VFAEHNSTLNLAEQLLEGNKVLCQNNPVHWRLPIAIDPAGGMPASAKMPSFLR